MKYWAFISYSSKDRRWGEWLRRRLENYRIPKDIRGQRLTDGAVLSKYLRPIFRDRDELPSSDNLGEKIQIALKNSRYLVVLCSPNSARSRWVNKEITDFQAMGNSKNILALILGGEPNSGDPENESFPPALRYPVEPIAGDLRKEGDGKDRGFFKIIAGIAQLDFDEIYRRHERAARRRRLLLTLVSITLILTFAGLAILAMIQRDKALRQEKRATAQYLATQSQLELQSSKAKEHYGTVGTQRAALLALESLKLTPTIQGDLALRAAIAKLPGRPNRFQIPEEYIFAFSNDGSTYLSVEKGSDSPDIRLRRIDESEVDQTMSIGNPGFELLRISPDWQWIAVGRGSDIELWSRSQKRLIQKATLDNTLIQAWFKPHTTELILLTGTSIIEWDWTTNFKEEFNLPDHTFSDNIHRTIDINAELGLIASNSEKPGLTFFEYRTGRTRRLQPGVNEWFPSEIALSPKGNFVAIATDGSPGVTVDDYEPKVEILEIDSWRLKAILPHEWNLQAIRFSPNEQFLITVTGHVSLDAADASATIIPGSTIRVWDISKSIELSRLPLGKEGGISNVQFNSDGEWLLTSNYEEAWVWNLFPTNLKREACKRLRRNLSGREAFEYLGIENPPRTCPNLPIPDGDGSYE